MKRHLPNLITCLNLATGCMGIYWVFSREPKEAIYFVLLAAFFDVLDGLTARLLKVSSEIGKQLDSLADLVSFGVLPAFYLLKEMENLTPFYWVAILIAVFSALRLARFNMDDSQKDSFRGLPTPANAMMLTSLVFSPLALNSAALLSIAMVSCFLLVSPLRLIALKFNSYGWKANEDKWILIFGSVILAIVFRWTFLTILVPYYILVSVISHVLKRY